MTLYGRTLEATIDPATDRIPILDASATGDDDAMRDITVAQLRTAVTTIIDIAGSVPTDDELPENTFGVTRNPGGDIELWYHDNGGGKAGLTLS